EARHVPDLDLLGGGRGHPLPVRTEGQDEAHLREMPARFPAGRFLEVNAVFAPRRQEPAVRAKHHTPTGHLVVAAAKFLTAAHVPRPPAPVEAGRRQPASVWGEGDAHEGSRLILRKPAELFTRRRVPDPKFALARMIPGPAGRYEKPAV